MASEDWIRDALAHFEAPLVRYATRLVGEAAAADVVQETFLALCQADRETVEDHLAAWLFRVCRNRALDLRRKDRRVQPLPHEQERALPSAEPGPAATLERREGESRVLAMIHTLPEPQQEVVFLRFAEGLSYRQIGEVTGHTVSHVGVLIHHAVKTIRTALARAEATGRRASQPAEVLR